MPNPFTPTPAQLELAEQRKLKRDQAKQLAKQEVEDNGIILPRDWIDLRPVSDLKPETTTLKIMTWNILAQSLVRRSLFPFSDCLKASQREHMLYREMLSHQADICCFQEVDRVEKVFPVLKSAGYEWVYAAGPRKKHGCLIAYRKAAFELKADKKILYDEMDIRTEGSTAARRGSSFVTKNIGSLVALKRRGDTQDGVVVATTHLFWHPAYTYERTRQVS